MRTDFRFDPPRMEVDAELRWLLVRAFGPRAVAGGTDGLDGDRVVDLGARLDLLPRVGARADAASLAREAGEPAAARIRSAYQAIAALAVQSEGLCRQLAKVAVDLGIPLVFLKGMALHLLGLVELGARGSCDVDVLVPEDAAGVLRDRLLANGYEDSGMPDSVHQLSPVTHPAGVVVEVHTMVWGVRPRAAGRSADLRVLLDEGLCTAAGDLGEGCFVPTREVLLAHVLVHGIAQHGLAPAAYPMTRMLADVQDLGLDEGGWSRFLDGGLRWISSDVSRVEAEAVAELVRRLGAGDDPVEIAGEDSNPSRMLRHVVAGVLDEAYQRSLKIRGFAGGQCEGGRAGAMVRDIGKAVWLTDAQIDAIYGRPRSRFGYLARRVLRPFDLVVRAVRYGWDWVLYRLSNF